MKKVILALLAPLSFIAGVITAKIVSKPEKQIEVVYVPRPLTAREQYDTDIDDHNYNNPDNRRLRFADTDINDTVARIDKHGADALNDPVSVDVKRANRRRETILNVIGFSVAVPITVIALLLIGNNDIDGGLAVALLLPPIWVAAILLATSFRGDNALRWWVRGTLTVLASAYCLIYIQVSAIAVITAIASVVIAAAFDWLAPLAPRWQIPTT